jgi:RNA polymerase sigma-70 factor (ECF subfamily)
VASGIQPEELRALYERFTPVVYRRALRLLGREADAWDVVQEVFRKLLESGASFKREAEPMTYVYRITTNLALNLLRSRGLREHASSDELEMTSERDSGAVEARDLLLKLFGVLTERAQRIAVLYFLDGLTQEEISLVVDLSRKTVGKELEEIRSRAASLGIPTPELTP